MNPSNQQQTNPRADQENRRQSYRDRDYRFNNPFLKWNKTRKRKPFGDYFYKKDSS